jgi:hypothetical protein
MSMPTSHPWLAPHSLRIGRREGGTQTREERSPSWCADEGIALMDDRGWWLESVMRKLLTAGRLLTPRSRGVLCRAWVRDQPSTTVDGQPGRERPPLPPPGPGPEPSTTGVAHAPAACLVCPDEVVRARAIDMTCRVSWNSQSDGRALHVETVAAVVHVFLNRRVPCH